MERIRGTGGDRRKLLGAFGEQLAENFLVEAGYRIVGRNWRCRTGEIDLIAVDGDILVFVEVRTRSSTDHFGTPLQSIRHRKRQKMLQTAQVYMHLHQSHDRQIRFDVISIITDGIHHEIDHLRGAF